jgi:hypothetical protein
MREREIKTEKRLVAEVQKMGGICLKLTSPSFNGLPDRLCLLPNGVAVFAEIKAKGEKARPLQIHRMEQLRKLGFNAFVIDDAEKIKEMLTKCYE